MSKMESQHKPQPQQQQQKQQRMEEVMKKLALWHTRTFRPIMTHDDLDPIMTTLGFFPIPLPPSSTESTATVWKEYAFSAAAASSSRQKKRSRPDVVDWNHLPRPRLPFPRIDGLHILTYRAFIDAVGFYLGTQRVADHFHVRGMPLHRVLDRVFDKVFRRMNDDRRTCEDDGIFVFREGTLDQATLLRCSNNTNTGNINNNNNSNSAASSMCIVPLKDIILWKDITV